MPSENAEAPLPNLPPSPRGRRAVAGIVAVLFLVPLVRFLWVTSQTTAGWEAVSQQWREASVGLVVGEYQQITYREPVEQAAFWLAEADRIVAEDPKNPELLMGTALLLAEPGMGFEIRHFRSTSSPIPDFNRQATDRAISDFESRCHPKCLALAKRATELQPDEPRWWRLRAALLFAGQWYDEHQWADRIPDWPTVLQECERHDPDNALYEYLAASHYWKDAVSYGVPITSPSVPTQSTPFGKGTAASVAPPTPAIDQAKYKRGMKHFLSGQQKRFCADGGGSQARILVLNALRRSAVPHAEHYYLASGSRPASAVDALRDLWRVLQVRAEQVADSGDAAGALAVFRQFQRSIDQLTQSYWRDETGPEGMSLRLSLFSPVKALVEKHPKLVSSEEAARIARNADGAQEDLKIWQDASIRLSKQQEAPFTSSLVAIGALSTAAVSALPLLLLAGMLGCAAATWLLRDRQPDAARLGIARQTIVWLVAYAATFVTFGMAPAKLISPDVQNWLFSGSIALFVAVAVGWVCWKVAVRRKLQFGIRFLLIVTAAWALLLGFLKICDVLPSDFSNLHVPAISVPAHRVGGIDPALFEQQWVALYGRWNWALDQWLAYRGPIISVAVALAIIAFWHSLRWHRADPAATVSFRNRWARRFACLGRSALVVATLWMLAYLWLMPTAVQFCELDYRSKIAYIEKPDEYRTALAKMMEKVKAEQSWRKGLGSSKAKP